MAGLPAGRWAGDISAERIEQRPEDQEAVMHNLSAADRLASEVIAFASADRIVPHRKEMRYPGLRLKMRFSTARLMLAVIPVGLFVASVILTREHGPYYQRNNLDPEYNYLLNSLSLLTLHAPTHNDHPGVTLRILRAAVE